MTAEEREDLNSNGDDLVVEESEEVEGAQQPEASAGVDESEGQLDGLVEAEEEAEEKQEEETEEFRGDWYVVHTYSGYENKVQQNLKHRIESMGAEDLIYDVVVPTEEVVELHQGQRRAVQRRIFPGYILVNMTLNDHSWAVVRHTPGVTGFVGSGKEPTPLPKEEVKQILHRMEAGAPSVKVSFGPGSKVRIIEGPFTDFIGTVDSIDNDRRRVRVMVNFFGRETPIDLDFLQVEEI